MISQPTMRGGLGLGYCRMEFAEGRRLCGLLTGRGLKLPLDRLAERRRRGGRGGFVVRLLDLGRQGRNFFDRPPRLVGSGHKLLGRRLLLAVELPQCVCRELGLVQFAGVDVFVIRVHCRTSVWNLV
jgi:hypothetical protein